MSALDEFGNEIAGVRLPHLVEPVATYTGWNVRPPIDGLPDLMPDFLGSRLACGGPPLHERYADRGDYEARVRDAAEELVAERYLLAEDVDLVTADARPSLRRIAHGRRNRPPVAFAGARGS